MGIKLAHNQNLIHQEKAAAEELFVIVITRFYEII